MSDVFQEMELAAQRDSKDAEIERLRAENSHMHHQTNSLAQDVLRLRAELGETNEALAACQSQAAGAILKLEREYDELNSDYILVWKDRNHLITELEDAKRLLRDALRDWVFDTGPSGMLASRIDAFLADRPESRSVQRRVASQRGEPAPEFDGGEAGEKHED